MNAPTRNRTENLRIKRQLGPGTPCSDLPGNGVETPPNSRQNSHDISHDTDHEIALELRRWAAARDSVSARRAREGKDGLDSRLLRDAAARLDSASVQKLRVAASDLLSWIYIFGLPDTESGRATLAEKLNHTKRALDAMEGR